MIGRLLIAVTVVLGCEFREDLGIDCSERERPVVDCTRGGVFCDNINTFCSGDLKCNGEMRRCFNPLADCRGVQCRYDFECGAGQRCNSASDTCFDPTADQQCMPCNRSDECGGGTCDLFTETCL